MMPDQRIGAVKSGQRMAAYSVDAFLAVLYESVAETLPDRFVRKGQAAGKDDEDCDDDPGDCDVEALKDWMDRPGKGPAWQTLDPSEKKICKYLAPGLSPISTSIIRRQDKCLEQLQFRTFAAVR